MSARYTIQEIADYLNGAMEPGKAATLKREAELNQALANEVDEQRKLSRLVQVSALKKKLNAIHDEFAADNIPVIPISQKTGKKYFWPLLAAAAAITGIMLFLVLFKSGNSYNTKLFNKYFNDDTGAPSLMGNSATPFDQAMVYYKDGDYEKAAGNFNRLLSNDPNNDTLKYYDALSLIRLNENGKALSLLNSVKVPAGSDLSVKAEWYTALLFVKRGDIEKAKTILTTVAGLSSPVYSNKAAALIKEIYKQQ